MFGHGETYVINVPRNMGLTHKTFNKIYKYFDDVLGEGQGTMARKNEWEKMGGLVIVIETGNYGEHHPLCFRYGWGSPVKPNYIRSIVRTLFMGNTTDMCETYNHIEQDTFNQMPEEYYMYRGQYYYVDYYYKIKEKKVILINLIKLIKIINEHNIKKWKDTKN
jgi:hypothetical protein